MVNFRTPVYDSSGSCCPHFSSQSEIEQNVEAAIEAIDKTQARSEGIELKKPWHDVADNLLLGRRATSYCKIEVKA